MATHDNRALVYRLVDAFNSGDLDVLDQLVAPDFVDHDRRRAELPRGPEGVKIAWRMFRNAFPDLYGVVDDAIVENDKVVVRGTFRGTHRGPLMGIPPTGKQITMTLIDINRFEHGLLVERWAEADMLGMLQQLGAVPAPEAAAG